ncbi:McrB family protein [Mycolicibacterium sp. HK-90]|uniref:McrB family protein n=1 Tax=Mycolicibacterium sp. HK-90 TaxID=3056937 RepID=UPI002657FEE6|nr:AAA family ATPase [Mycolicibacterium sp. HK-90]WKG04634.1 AAA family ATPase [Mycolicibacterium sp. HK-90]
MTADEVVSFGRKTAPHVEKIGRRLIEAGFGYDDSLLTPGQAIWTAEHLAELQRDYVDRPDMGPDDFFEKLEQQLAASSPGAIQLFAELLIVNVLPLTNLGGPLKVKHVRTVLGLSKPSVEMPADVEQVLAAGGVYHGGQAFGNYRWKQLVYLIEVAQHFKALPPQRRVDALADPLVFRAEVDAVPTGQAAQRQSLLYLAFPQFFLPIVNGTQRRAIRDAFAPQYLDHPVDDVDVDLHDINEAIMEEQGGPADLYASPWIERWQKASTPPPTDKVRHAWKVHGSNVKGQDMVPRWRKKGTVSLAASLLRPIDPDVTREQLKAFVDEDYRSSGYAARQEKFDEFYTFLARMHPGDLIVTVSQGQVYFASITGDAEFVKSDDGRSNLRRTVKWHDRPLLWSDLPSEVAARMSAQGEVLDLSQHLDTLLALAERRVPTPGASSLNLPDASDDLAARLHVSREWLQECIDLLRDRPQLIFYGPPGTGKTYVAKELARYLTDQANVTIVQFHPAYSYEDFFEGYRPQGGSDGQVGFTLTPGPLRSLVDRATENPDAVYVLIIDEINRGNLPKIFGELYFLLEYRDESIDLLYSSDTTEPFSLPKNIILLGTMNTADRSIALVDAAIRRRFAFLPLHPSEEPTSGILRSWLVAKGHAADVADLLDELNARIADSDFKIGPSYFMRPAVFDGTGKGLERVWRTDILPLMEEHHYGDRNIDVRARYGLDVIRKAVKAKAAAAAGDSGALPPSAGPGTDDTTAADPD